MLYSRTDVRGPERAHCAEQYGPAYWRNREDLKKEKKNTKALQSMERRKAEEPKKIRALVEGGEGGGGQE